MTKLRFQGAFHTFILSAAVALFCGVLVSSDHKNAGQNAPVVRSNSSVVLTADGSDPVPAPIPTPWLGKNA